MSERSVWLRGINRFLWLLIAGGVLFLCMAQSEYLLTPRAWELIGHSVYRVAFFIVLPFRLLVTVALPASHHHYSLLHLVVACFGTPFFWWIVVAAGRRAVRPVPSPVEEDTPLREADLIGRRQFLVRSTLSTVGTAAGTLGGYASLVAPEQLCVRRYQQPILDLPNALHGLRLVQVSDTHYGPYVSMTYLEYVIKQANALDGDLVVLTGDYVHLTPKAIPGGIGVLEGLQGRMGRVAVLGNHEHWEGARACRQEFQRIDIPLIDNERLFLTPEGLTDRPVHGQSLCVAGVGDLWTDRVSISAALRGVPDGVPRIVLSHNPDVAETMDAEHRVDLMLSGHTHGGQVRLPVIGAPACPSRYGAKYLGGRCHGPRCPVIVSRGIGLAGIPLRFRVPPELCVITLVKANTMLV